MSVIKRTYEASSAGYTAGTRNKLAVITYLQGWDKLIAQFEGAPKALRAAMKRATRKALTPVIQTMRTKLPKKGKAIKLDRKATIKEKLRDIGRGIFRTIEANLRKVKRKKKGKPAYKTKALQTGMTGMLRKSLGLKVAINRKTGQVYGMVGPRRKKDFQGGTAWSAWMRKMVPVIPSKYAHLVDNGFILKVRGKAIRKIPGRGFIRSSFDENRAKIETIVTQVFEEDLQKLFSKQSAAAAKAAAQAMDMAGGGE
jgi:hypothetical protein